MNNPRMHRSQHCVCMWMCKWQTSEKKQNSRKRNTFLANQVFLSFSSMHTYPHKSSRSFVTSDRINQFSKQPSHYLLMILFFYHQRTRPSFLVFYFFFFLPSIAWFFHLTRFFHLVSLQIVHFQENDSCFHWSRDENSRNQCRRLEFTNKIP